MDPIMQAILASLKGGGAGGVGTAGPAASSFSFGNILKNLKKKPKSDEPDLSGFLGAPKIERGTMTGAATQYDPRRIYGGLYDLYGGRRVRGGLLGD
jgi:hypothetical protein